MTRLCGQRTWGDENTTPYSVNYLSIGLRRLTCTWSILNHPGSWGLPPLIRPDSDAHAAYTSSKSRIIRVRTSRKLSVSFLKRAMTSGRSNTKSRIRFHMKSLS